MNPFVKNSLAVISGLIIGSFVNGALINLSSSIIPPPNGADVTSLEGLKASMHLFGPKNFIFPFLAHALGTLVGAIIASAIAPTNKNIKALVIGIVFLIGGAINVFLLPSPLWFSILDLSMAYLPMAYLGAKLVNKKQ